MTLQYILLQGVCNVMYWHQQGVTSCPHRVDYIFVVHILSAYNVPLLIYELTPVGKDMLFGIHVVHFAASGTISVCVSVCFNK